MDLAHMTVKPVWVCPVYGIIAGVTVGVNTTVGAEWVLGNCSASEHSDLLTALDELHLSG